MDFGAELRQARERRGISLQRISAATKISLPALEALERNEFSRLPGGIFTRAFIRSYASEVGLDPEETVRRYVTDFAEPTGALTFPVERVDEDRIDLRQAVSGVLWLLVLAGVAGALIYLLIVNARGRATEAQSATAGQHQTEEPLPLDTPAKTTGSTTSTPSDGGPPPAEAPAPEVLALSIHPTGPCWVSAKADGESKVSRLMQSGERENIQARNEILVIIGDAATFAFDLGGVPGKSLGGAGQVVTARITKDNFRTYLRQ